MHPDGRSWACTGQSAKVGFYTDLKDVADLADVDLEDGSATAQDDEDQDDKTSESLGKLVKVIETGRGKFGMELKYVGHLGRTSLFGMTGSYIFPVLLEPRR